MDIRKRSFTGSARESELPIVPLVSQGNITLREERGNTFIMLLKERRKEDCGNALNSKRFGNSGGSYAGRPNESESLRKKMIGKSYSGKPNVRFDEGELEIEHSYYASSLLYPASLAKFERRSSDEVRRKREKNNFRR